MRVNYLQLSNILSFKYEEDINNAFKIEFDPDLNIIIGENGSGKSTVLEAMNLVFTRALFKRITNSYSSHRSYYTDRKNMLQIDDNYSNRTLGLRLQPNWSSEEAQQRVRVSIKLDNIDRANIDHIVDNYSHIKKTLENYSIIPMPEFCALDSDMDIEIDITFKQAKYDEDNTYKSHYRDPVPDYIKFYLEYYHAINEAITVYNEDNTDHIAPLENTFSMLSAFRDYGNDNSQIHLYNGDGPSGDVFQNVKNRLIPHSINEHSSGMPAIFDFIKLKLGEDHFKRVKEGKNINDATATINNSPIIKKINEKLRILNLQLSVKPVSIRRWSYEFKFRDIKNDRELGDINSLSAGQKSIIHLIFEAYGRDDVKGGLIIIDEPEIHLHYQFQSKYLKILEDLAKEQEIQCILVTHSEGFINDNTIRYIKRFSLNEERNSVVRTPDIREDQKKLIEILNNTWAARVLFLDRVLLVEGQDDEYFFRAAIKILHQEASQCITVYGVNGERSMFSFKSFFESFGLKVYFIKDLDTTKTDFYRGFYRSQKKSLPPVKTDEQIIAYRNEHPDLDEKIESKYPSYEFYLKKGAIEQYTGKEKRIDHVIDFCENEMDHFLNSDDDRAREIRKIIDLIADKDGDSTH
ncbi:AAA family ATPase [Candidatus Saccharibacteria bacterium oral taxon 488]|nr:AAA family ATPase [Candidatus Saccharibacteria bacterium oral taxon 488]